MAYIRFDQVSLRYPMMDVQASHLRNQIANWLSFGATRKRAGTVWQVDALKGVSFEICQGDRVGLIGANGAGKSTLLRTIAGIYTPQGGKVDVQGEAVSLMFDIDAGTAPELTGRENVLTLGMTMGFSAADCRAITRQVETFSELGEFFDMPMEAYSSGMRMRLSFSLATAMIPDILLLDEWFSTGDAAFQRKCVARLETMLNKSAITVFASHDHGLLRRCCTRFFLLESGSVRELPENEFDRLMTEGV
ncbi:ABC transporter ATP-binding protein [Bordetella avium]|uniref:O-antigen export ABC transporter,ATP-binding protein n=1 Tax=Bordetella avium (strain 197N) TaxID=360910 RepID=Q2KUG4_BORA1|nr:ATP-binding cassette domain-containing protein [Bordetella avium]AZY50424.1 ABC transporter ATP-binding protein [Bordetella avium]AZY53820.1 ABC transporter ATP-binding protein [Bordetella avium]RIQ15408.1 ABC transporter ATP-binding protein [Bordetella avium]RIQ19786.1 ABC transporter ATP-binding protein [Bordetella avium]RIQ34367.1 ABC transporter ATP-binding protein [Bordetella avium]